MVVALKVHGREPLRRRLRQVQTSAMGSFGFVVICLGALVTALTFSKSSVIGLSLGGPIVLVGLLFVVLALTANRRARRQHRKRLAALAETLVRAPPLSPIADAEGRCLVRGRVRVLAFPSGADHNLAAKAIREVGTGKDDRLAMTNSSADVTDINEVRSCGRFAVIDDSGVAVIDPDDFEVVSRETVDPFLPVVVTAEQDDLVEIVGTGRRVPATTADGVAELLGQAGYREAGRKVLLFEGADEPVLIVGTRR